MRWLRFIAKLFGRVVSIGLVTSFIGWLIGSFLGVLWGNPKTIIELLILTAVIAIIGVIIYVAGKYAEWSWSPPLLEKKK